MEYTPTHMHDELAGDDSCRTLTQPFLRVHLALVSNTFITSTTSGTPTSSSSRGVALALPQCQWQSQCVS